MMISHADCACDLINPINRHAELRNSLPQSHKQTPPGEMEGCEISTAHRRMPNPSALTLDSRAIYGRHANCGGISHTSKRHGNHARKSPELIQVPDPEGGKSPNAGRACLTSGAAYAGAQPTCVRIPPWVPRHLHPSPESDLSSWPCRTATRPSIWPTG
jgi:hypothetical protein